MSLFLGVSDEKYINQIKEAMKMNESIKKEIKASRLKIWELANYMGIPQSTLYRRLNNNMSAVDKEKILQAIKDLNRKLLEESLKEAK